MPPSPLQGGFWGCPSAVTLVCGATCLPVLNQPSEVKAAFVSSGLSQYSRNTEGPLTKSSPSFSSNPGVTCGETERWASDFTPSGWSLPPRLLPRPTRSPKIRHFGGKHQPAFHTPPQKCRPRPPCPPHPRAQSPTQLACLSTSEDHAPVKLSSGCFLD